jgi:hypothetical protein
MMLLLPAKVPFLEIPADPAEQRLPVPGRRWFYPILSEKLRGALVKLFSLNFLPRLI